MKNVNVGQKVMVSLEYYVKNDGVLVIPPFGEVTDVNSRLVTMVDNYGHSWNIDKIYLEDDYIEDSEIKNGDSFNDKVVKNFIQLFENTENLDEIESKVDRYFDSKLNPFDCELGKTLNLIRSIEKYSVLSEFSEESQDKAEYLYDYVQAKCEENNMNISGATHEEEKKPDIKDLKSFLKGDNEGSINPLDYLTDMTKIAKENPYDKAYGRDKEIKEVMRVVKHRDKKNAILVGKQGCGKTTIIEELANRIAAGEIPSLKGKKILAMDVDGMIAGTKYRGMFEERCKAVLSYCANEKDAIVFIDEVHKIMGAGGNTEGGMNLGNLMKTYLTKGISVIGATTYDEYANLKDDAALARRFGIIPIEEQEPEVVKWILGEVKDEYEKFHDVKVTETLLSAIVDTFDQKNYNTAGIDYAKNALDSICTIMEMDGVSQSEAFREFIDSQNYDKEENNEYVKRETIGFGTEREKSKKTSSEEKVYPKQVQDYIDLLEKEDEKDLLDELLKDETLEELSDEEYMAIIEEEINNVSNDDANDYDDEDIIE